MLKDFRLRGAHAAVQPRFCGRRGAHAGAGNRRRAPPFLAWPTPCCSGRFLIEYPGRLVYRLRRSEDAQCLRPSLVRARLHRSADHAERHFEDVAAVSTGRATFTRRTTMARRRRWRSPSVTPNIFRLLGARIVLGRDFIDSDGQPEPATADGAPPPPDQRLPTIRHRQPGVFPAAVRRQSGDLGAAGREERPDSGGRAGARRGVAVPSGQEHRAHGPICGWPLRLHYSEACGSRSPARDRAAAARRDADSGRRPRPMRSPNRAARIEPTYRGAGLQFRLEPMQRYLVAQVRPAILALMGAVIFLLLIACSNVANLFLVRASLRGRDLAVRTAMGASWWRLARQMLAEALLVAAIGSALGFGLAWAGIRELAGDRAGQSAAPRCHPDRPRGARVQHRRGIGGRGAVRPGAGVARGASGCGAGAARQRADQRAERRRRCCATRWWWRRWRCVSCCWWGRA